MAINNRKLVKMLKQEAEIVTPNKLAYYKTVLNIPNNKNNKLSSFYNPNLSKILLPIMSSAFIIIGVSLTISSQVSLNNIQAIETELTDYSYVTLSGASSVEIVVDNNTLTTKSIRGLNKNGVVLTYDENLEDVSLSTTIKTLTTIANQFNLEDEITISTIALDNSLYEQVNDVVSTSIANASPVFDVTYKPIADKAYKKSEQYKISPSKLNLIYEVTSNKSYSLESLLNKPISELHNLSFDINNAIISQYQATLREEYTSYLNELSSSSEYAFKENIDVYDEAKELLKLTNAYLFKKLDDFNMNPNHGMNFNDHFDWHDFMDKGPCPDFYEGGHMDIIQEVTYDELYTKIGSFLNNKSEVYVNLFEMSDGIFTKIDISKITETSYDELISLSKSLMYFVDYFFPHYLYDNMQEIKGDLQVDFKDKHFDH